MKTSIIVQNLKCGGCAHTITTKLSEIDEISDINVNVEENTIALSHPNEQKLVEVKEKLKKLGYPKLDDGNTLASKAKSFLSCATGKFSK